MNGNGAGSGPLTLEQLLREHGPYFDGEPPTDTELFARLTTFGAAFHRLPNRTERELARQVWEEFLQKQMVPAIPKPWRVVTEAILAGGPNAAGGGVVLRGYSDREILALPDPEWTLDGLLLKAGLAELVGRWGAGKTFLLIDWAMHIAAGLPWQGRMVKRGPVLYLYGEGSMKLRVAAWRAAHRVPPEDTVGVTYLPGSVNLLSVEAVDGFVAAVLAEEWGTRPVLIVFETLSRMTPGGDENSSETAGLVIAASERIQRETGAAVLLSHHTPWNQDQQRPRGHTKLPDAADVVFLLDNQQGALKLTCLKMREGEAPAPIHLRLTPQDGALVVDQGQAPPPKQDRDADELLVVLGDQELTRNEIVARLVLSDRTARRRLQALLVAGRVVLVPGTGIGRSPARYRATGLSGQLASPKGLGQVGQATDKAVEWPHAPLSGQDQLGQASQATVPVSAGDAWEAA